MLTIKFYTDNHKYMGWNKRKEYREQYLMLRSWIISGNYLVVRGQILDKIKDIQSIWGY